MVPSIVVCVSVCGIDCVVRTESSSVSAGLGWGGRTSGGGEDRPWTQTWSRALPNPLDNLSLHEKCASALGCHLLAYDVHCGECRHQDVEVKKPKYPRTSVPAT